MSEQQNPQPTMPRRAKGNGEPASTESQAQLAMPERGGASSHDAVPASVREGKRRQSFGAGQSRYPTLPDHPGFWRYWFSDIAGRIDLARECGYEFVKDKDGKPYTVRAGVAPTGGPLLQYAMEIPVEWRQEDQIVQERRENDIELAMRAGAKNANNQDDANRYVADHLGGTQIRRAAR